MAESWKRRAAYLDATRLERVKGRTLQDAATEILSILDEPEAPVERCEFLACEMSEHYERCLPAFVLHCHRCGLPRSAACHREG